MELITISEVALLLGVKLTSAYLYLELGVIPNSASKKKVGKVWARTWDKDAISSCMDKVAERKARNGVRGKDKKIRARRMGNNITRKDCFLAAEILMNKNLIN